MSRPLLHGGTFFALGMATALVPSCLRERVTATSLSPDDRARVVLAEAPRFGGIDRNVRIRLELLQGDRTHQLLFTSPDEGSPEGSERFLWSKDGSTFLLVGRHFTLRNPIPLASGERPYFLYHLPTGQAWCNSEQQSELPRFTREKLETISWTEPLKYASEETTVSPR